MIFKELIQKTQWKDIKQKMLELYPDEYENLGAYRYVWYQLVYILDPKQNNMEILICDRVDDLLGDYEIYQDVSGWDGIQRWAIEFTPWEEWLGMKINEETLKKYSRDEIVVHCMWEMTYCGFNQKEIKEEIDELNKRVEEVKSGDVKTVKLSEFLVENNKYKDINDAIQHAESVADLYKDVNETIAERKEQLVKWLRELKEFKEKYK